MPTTIQNASLLGSIPVGDHINHAVLLEDWDTERRRIVWVVGVVFDLLHSEDPYVDGAETYDDVEAARWALIERATR